MSELQSTIEFSIELFKFYNVDLFQRGMYQVRCCLRVSSKLSVEVEVTTPEVTTGLGSAIILGNYGACRPFQILYRNEEVSLKDVVMFRCHMLVDGNNLKESLERAEFSLVLELWFSDSSPANMVIVSTRTLQLNMSPIEGLHYHLPVLFDYFHLSAISLTIHAALTALHQPSQKRGILRYVQSCAPKTSKSWSKTRSAHCTSLTDPVLPVSSHKIYSRINESPQVHLEAYNVLLDSSNNLKTTIKDYKILLLQREECVAENYDTLIVKHNQYDSTKFMKKHPFVQTSGLAELCADNIRLWNYFLLTFSCKIAIQQHLSKKHHNLKVRRFAEMFFLIYNPRRSAFGCYETNYQKYLVIAEVARRSKYMQMLPPLPVHCVAMDGDSATMPVIFEDQYQDPFQYQKRNCEILSSGKNLDPWTLKSTVNFDNSNCSCGIGNLWEPRKNFEKNDLFLIDGSSVPTRHSKSLDQLQPCSKNYLNYSLNNILGQKDFNNTYQLDKSRYYRIEKKLKNVASEQNIQHRKYFLENPVRKREKYNDSDICDCSIINYSLSTKAKKQPQELNFIDTSLDLKQLGNGALEKKYKQFNIKNLTNVKKHQYQSLVKSISHTSTDSTQNIFRSHSMQFFSPKKKVSNGINKFNSLLTKRNQNRKLAKTDSYTYASDSQAILIDEEKNGFHENEQRNQNIANKNNNSSKSKSQRVVNGKRVETSSTSSSTESLFLDKINTGFNSEILCNVRGIRKVRSTSCLGEDVFPLSLSGTESLPNITPKLEERINYPEMKYFSSSTSSATSEQSGWISSRSSSVASSTDVTNPATSAIITNIDDIQKKLLNLSCESKKRTCNEKKLDNSTRKHKSNKFYLGTDTSSNDHCKEYQDLEKNLPLFKGCDFTQSNICEDIALPPPKQFRDLDSPASSILNGTTEEEINAVDNLLYHVVDTQTTLERKPSQFNLKSSNETEEFHFYRGSNMHTLKTFLKAKEEFKSQLKFPGLLYYSEMNSFASTIPYFHISDEFRIFSPEGMHLVVCVHGLDGNSADLRLVKTYLELGLPGAYLDFLMSERNQGDTFSDFETMTDRLVSEILQYLDTSSIRPTRISFVGHSLGNVIIRSALTRPELKFLLPRLHTFLSLSGPHLGTLYNSSGLVNMGMWFMQKWKKSGSLLQLCLKDSQDARQSFLYRLSQRSTLHNFKNILLCGSGQDRYVPLHSARIELCKESIKDTSDQGAIYREMVHNILSPIIAQKELKLLRYDIHYALPNTANALIGRAAHIAVLDSDTFIEKFMAVVGIKYFR